jgi:protein phosphatase
MISDPHNLDTLWPPGSEVNEEVGETQSTQIEAPADLDDEIDELPTIVLPMRLTGLADAARTDVGQQREHNEDYFGLQVVSDRVDQPSQRQLQAQGLYILCDGMGGHAGGEVASRLAVETLAQYFQTHWHASEPNGVQPTPQLPAVDVIRQAIIDTNQVIFAQNQAKDRLGNARMGTTLVMLLLCGTQVAYAHVGDSRLYRFTRKRGLEQLTIDDEVGQREMQRGVPFQVAYGRSDAYQLTQALGPRDETLVQPTVQCMELSEDTLFILASDGLTDNDLLEQHCATHVEPLISSQSNLEQGAKQLIELANQYNGHDNITAVLVRAQVRPDVDQMGQLQR